MKILFSLAFLWIFVALAESTPVQKAQKDLKDKKSREETIKQGGINAKRADDFATDLMGNEKNKDELYEISAEILPYINEKSGGDPAKMKTLLEEYQKNPEAFYKDLPESTRQKIKKLSEAPGIKKPRDTRP